MKVAVLTTSFPRWAGDYFGNYILSVAAEHVKSGAQVRVVAPHAKGARSREWLEGVEVFRFRYAVPSSMEVLAYGEGIFTKLKSSLTARLQLPVFFLSFLLRSLRAVLWADIVHVHWTLAGVIGVVLARLLRKRSVLTIYGIEVFTGRARTLTKLCVRWADSVICISTATEEKMRELVGPGGGGNSIVIPYGVSEDFLTADGAGFDLRAQHRISEGSCIVLSVGRLIERKGIIHLLRAVPLVIRHAPAHFIIVGEGPERPRLERLAAELGVQDLVTFAGAVPAARLPGYYAQCDLFVHPVVTDASGDVEGLGIVLLEAMARGKPIVASIIGGITDVVADGETGYLVPEQDEASLAGRLVQLLHDPDLRQRMGLAGRLRVEEQFSVPSLADKVLQAYILCQRRAVRV